MLNEGQPPGYCGYSVLSSIHYTLFFLPRVSSLVRAPTHIIGARKGGGGPRIFAGKQKEGLEEERPKTGQKGPPVVSALSLSLSLLSRGAIEGSR